MEEEEINIEPVKQQNRFQKFVESILRVFGIEDFISYAQVMHNFFFVAAIVFIGVVEIFNTHLAVRLNREIVRKQNDIKELRWEYMTVKTNMNQKSKQSELQKTLEPYGLKPLVEAPQKIEVKKGTLN